MIWTDHSVFSCEEWHNEAMRTSRITLELPSRFGGWKKPHLVALHYHGGRLSRQGGCIGINPSRTSTPKSRPGHQALTKAQSELVSHPVPIPEGDWLPYFISWLHANGASGVNQHGAKLALYEEESKAGSLANRGIVFTEASMPWTTSTPCLQDPMSHVPYRAIFWPAPNSWRVVAACDERSMMLPRQLKMWRRSPL